MTAIALALALYLFVAVVALGAARPDYSQVRDTISQLGERGVPRGRFAGLGVFLPVGLGLWGIAYCAWHQSPLVALLASCMGIGYAVGGLFPCDRGLPRHGSWRQQIHDAAGLIEYLGGAYAIYRIERAPYVWAALFIPAAAAAAFIRPLAPVRGLLQRVAEAILFGALTLALFRLQK